MFQLFLRVFVRHLFKNKFSNLLNFGGLAFAFALVYVIGVATTDALYSDAWLDNSDRIYRINWVNNGVQASPVVHGPVGPLIAANIADVSATSRLVNRSVTAYRHDEGFRVRAAFTDPDFAKIFNLPLIEGSLTDTLLSQRGIALSAQEAERLFGKTQGVVGKVISIGLATLVHDYTVMAIFHNLPQASHLSVDALMPLIPADFNAIGSSYILESFNNTGRVATYVTLKEGVDEASFQTNFFPALKTALPQEQKNSPDTYTAENIVGLQFWSSTEHGHMKNPVNTIAVTGSAVMALLVLIAAVSNHINLTIAATLRRGREVAIRLVLGGSKGQVIRQLFIETLIVMSLAAFVSLDIAHYLGNITGSFLGQEIAFNPATRGSERGVLVILVLAASLLTALYPSLWLKSVKSGVLLASSGRALTGGASRARAILVAVQVGLGAAIIFSTLTIYRQVDFLTDLTKGFEDSSLVHVDLSFSEAGRANRAAFFEEVRKLSDTETITAASVIPYISSDSRTGFQHPRLDKHVEYESVLADANFFNTYEIKPVAGRLLRDDFGANSLQGIQASSARAGNQVFEQNLIVSEALVRQHGFASNEEAIGGLFRFWNFTDANGNEASMRQTIVGVVPDIAFKAGKSTQVATFYENNSNSFWYLTVKSRGGDASVAKAQVEGIWKDFFPNDPFSFSYPADNLAEAYLQENNMLEVFAIAGVVCLLITIAGLSGLARYVALQRRREFAIRRVVGATQMELLRLAAIQFGKPVLLGLMVGIPAAHLSLADWLGQYQTRVATNYGETIAFIALAAIFSLAIVLYEVRRGTQFRPADILGHE
ncbi:MAG: ABC transporter permease [Kordiimonadaceae bacterium]|nr:ABC transporter permease [Kordiimonadaceae bacterium]